MEQTTYAYSKTQQLLRASSTRIYGTILERVSNTPVGATARKEPYMPVGLCFCVQDSPDNPCPCTSDLIIWIPVDQIISSGKLDNKEGKSLHYFDVRRDADLLMERMFSFKASVYENRKKLSNLSGISSSIEVDEPIEEFLDLLRTSPTFPEPNKENDDVVLYSWRNIVGAFRLGWKVGTYINKKTGLSDKIADWLCEKDPNCWTDKDKKE